MIHTRQCFWLSAAASTAAVCLLCTQSAPAQDLRRLLPRPDFGRGAGIELPTPDDGAGELEGGEQILIERLVGIDLLGDGVASLGAGTPAVPVTASGLELPRPRRLRSQLLSRIGSPLSLNGLAEIADTVVAHYQNNGVPAIEVWVPEQEVTDGRIRLVVAEGKVGNVAIAEGEHFAAEQLGAGLRSSAGDRLTLGRLYDDLDWLNRNPFIDASLAVAPGEGIAEADLIFTLADRRPLRFYGGFENSGVELLGEERWVTGVEWGNAFGLGHRLLYQATLGIDYDAFRGHALDYRAPLPWRHELGLQAAIVKSEAELEDGSVSGGTSWLLGPSYAIPLPRSLGGALRHELALGFQWKSTDNNLEFGGNRVFDSTAKIAQFTGAYLASFEREAATTTLLGELVHSPGGIGSDNDDESFAEIRGDARSRYTFLRGGARHVRRLPGDAAMVLRAAAQWSDTPLLPSEAIAIGGQDAVRGYPERDGLGDLGYFASFELRSPTIGLPAKRDGRLQVLGFIDYGRSWPKDGRGGAQDRDLASAGSGLRYRFNDRIDVRFDYAWQLDGEGSRAHIAARLEF